MQFIEEIRYKKGFRWETLQSIRYNKSTATRGILQVTLRDMQTGCCEVLSTYSSVSAFEKAIRKSDPYGYVRMKRFGNDFLLVKSDKLSFQFLQYVESVTPIEFPTLDRRVSERLSCHFYDSVGSFVEWWYTDEQYVCPLFQMLCLLRNGWYEGKFYFRNNELRGHKVKSGMCVTFTDAHKARAMIAKALATGYNPMKKYAIEQGFGGGF